MRGFNSLLVLTLSFVSLAVSGPLHSNIHSSPFARSPVPSRQFHYRRTLGDICANVDLSAAGLGLVGLSGDICLCLSTLDLDLEANVNLKATLGSAGEVDLKAVVRRTIFLLALLPSHAVPLRSANKAPSVPTLITLPLNVLPETPATSHARMALLNKVHCVSAPPPILFAMGNVALTRTFVPLLISCASCADVSIGLQFCASKGSENDAKRHTFSHHQH